MMPQRVSALACGGAETVFHIAIFGHAASPQIFSIRETSFHFAK
jgi:hypothetical protein